MRVLITFILFLYVNVAIGQELITEQDSVSIDTTFNYMPMKLPVKFSEISLLPSFQFGNQSAKIGLVYSQGKIFRHGFSAKSVSLDVGFLTKNNIYTSSIGWRASFLAMVFGGDIGVKGNYYWHPNGNSAFALRPEIGLLFFNVVVNYGYDIFLNKNDLPLKNHNFTVSVFIPIFGK